MQISQKDPVVITGCGWVTPFALGGIEAVLQAATGRTLPPAMPQVYWPIPDELLNGCPDLSQECRNDPSSWLAAVAFECAKRDAAFVTGSVPPERIGLVLGNALAGQSGMIDFANDVRQQSPRFVSPIRFPQTVGNYITGALSRAYDIRGPNSTIACGSASGLAAIVEGCALLSAGKADVIFAGGTERLTPTLATGLAEPDVIFSDGACLFVLERREHAVKCGATVLATIVPPFDQSFPEPPDSSGAPGCVCSTVGFRESGAIFIEHWIGRCLGAQGAAAVAAAIGAGRGLVVPIVNNTDSSVVSVRQSIKGEPPASTTAVVTVLADDGYPTSMMLMTAPAVLRADGTTEPRHVQ